MKPDINAALADEDLRQAEELRRGEVTLLEQAAKRALSIQGQGNLLTDAQAQTLAANLHALLGYAAASVFLTKKLDNELKKLSVEMAQLFLLSQNDVMKKVTGEFLLKVNELAAVRNVEIENANELSEKLEAYCKQYLTKLVGIQTKIADLNQVAATPIVVNLDTLYNNHRGDIDAITGYLDLLVQNRNRLVKDPFVTPVVATRLMAAVITEAAQSAETALRLAERLATIVSLLVGDFKYSSEAACNFLLMHHRAPSDYVVTLFNGIIAEANRVHTELLLPKQQALQYVLTQFANVRGDLAILQAVVSAHIENGRPNANFSPEKILTAAGLVAMKALGHAPHPDKAERNWVLNYYIDPTKAEENKLFYQHTKKLYEAHQQATSNAGFFPRGKKVEPVVPSVTPAPVSGV